MPDVTALAAIGSNIKVAYDLGKAILEAKGQLDAAELKLKLADIIGALADAKMEIASAQDELRDKDARIRQLEGALETREEVVRLYDAFYQKGPNGKPVGQPYCMACWERDHKLFHLALRRGIGNTCTTCKAVFDPHRTQTMDGDA
jgi:hypothetical protein